MLQAADKKKDQTYFLSLVPQVSHTDCMSECLMVLFQLSLRKTLFPVGHMTKDMVKQVALEHGWTKIVARKEVSIIL